MDIIRTVIFLVNIAQCISTRNKTIKTNKTNKTNKTGHRLGKYSVAGLPASILNYPSAVYLESPRTKCTGTLISKKYILTAGHCLKKKYMFAYTGHRLKHCGRIHEIDSFAIHPDYKFIHVNDIAILKLRHSVKISRMVKLLHMARREDEFPINTTCIIAGWGRLSRVKKLLTNQLHYGFMKIEDPEKCAGKSSFNREREICAGKIDLLQHITGKGDSGTALRCYRESDGVLVLAGVDSRAPQKNLTIFTKVSFYRDWIDSKIDMLKRQELLKQFDSEFYDDMNY